MSTSGTITYSRNARQLVTFALKKACFHDALETPTSDEMDDALEELNLMLKGWQLSGPNLWRQTFGSAALLAATASYALTPRPFRVEEVRYRNASGIDTTMMELTRQEYVDMPQKSSTGTPTQFYVDYQRSGAVLYVWPTLAAVTTETLQFTYQRMFEDVTALVQDIDVPSECLELVAYSLADRLADTYRNPSKSISMRARELMAFHMDADREAVVRFQPERSR